MQIIYIVDPVLKEAAANAAGPNATLANLPPGAQIGVAAAEGEQDMKDNNETVQNNGSQ